jgi:hypothetical protein
VRHERPDALPKKFNCRLLAPTIDFQESDLILAPAGRKERDREVQSLASDGLCRAANLIADLSISTGLKHGDFLEPVGMELLGDGIY